eukprot:sb/3466925/
MVLQKSFSASVIGLGLSTSFRSPRVASSRVRFWRVSGVWFTTRTSKTMSYWLTLIPLPIVNDSNTQAQPIYIIVTNWFLGQGTLSKVDDRGQNEHTLSNQSVPGYSRALQSQGYLVLQKSSPASVIGLGLSTSFRSPRVASSRVRFWRVSGVWFTTRTSKTMSYWLTLIPLPIVNDSNTQAQPIYIIVTNWFLGQGTLSKVDDRGQNEHTLSNQSVPGYSRALQSQGYLGKSGSSGTPGSYFLLKTTNQDSFFRSRDWLSANQGPVFPTLYWRISPNDPISSIQDCSSNRFTVGPRFTGPRYTGTPIYREEKFPPI